MRAHAAVPLAELCERALKLLEVVDRPEIERCLQRAKEALNATILPGATSIDALMLYADHGG